MSLIMKVAQWAEPQLSQLLSLFVGAAALAMGASLLISRRLYEVRDQIKGLKMVFEPKSLRFFQARFEPFE